MTISKSSQPRWDDGVASTLVLAPNRHFRGAAIFGSTASPLHKALPLAGIAKFDTNTSALVTTRVKRCGAYGTTCAVP